MSILDISSTYNFSVYANSVLGSSYKGAKLVSVLDYSMAVRFGSVDMINKQVRPMLPPGTPTDHRKFKYYIFDYRGRELLIAEPWIVPGSIELTEGVSYTLTLNSVSDHQVSLIRDQLSLLGISYELA